MNLKILPVSFILTFFLCLGTTAQNYEKKSDESYSQKAIVKTPFPVKSICWNRSDELFAYSEGDVVFIRNAADYKIVNTLTIENISDLYFSKEGKDDVLLALYDYGTVSIWNLKDSEPILTEDYKNSKDKKAVAFSKDSNYIAVTLEDNSIQLYFKLRYTRKTISRKLKGHYSKIISLSFSDDSKYLLSASEDGNVYIWNCDEYSLVTKISDLYSATKVSPVFSSDGKMIFACTDSKELSAFLRDGTKKLSIDVKSEIKKIQPLMNGNQVAVLTEDNKIKIYDISSDKYTGYIPAYNESEMTDFMFSSDDSYVLAGFADGSIYRLKMRDSVLLPGKIPPKYRLIHDDEVVVKGSMLRSKILIDPEASDVPENNGEETEKITLEIENPSDYFIEKIPVKDTRSSVYLFIGADYFNPPLLLGPDAGAEVRILSLAAPFYFGAGIRFGSAFTDERRCKYSYSINGVKQRLPFLLTGTIYIPFGIMIPLKQSRVQLAVNCRAGGMMGVLCFISSSGSAAGNPDFSFYVSAAFGVQFDNFEINAGCQFDLIEGVSPFIELGYNIRFGKVKKNGIKK